MNDFLLFFILRLLALIPSVILAIVQGIILVKKWGQHNGMKPYRILLFLVTLSFAVDSAIVASSDFAGAFLGISHRNFFGGLTEIRVFSRFLELGAIWYFYKIIYDVRKDGPDHK